ncbi:polysaccharide deacetylase family protein [Kitasatospora azatica]|uniref:polysaccharide deacetylase family protein n=1 Tax=Kitasatospora azatica TaxID=58347 RepID=UPI00068A767C|nr:polysaccharide deacetylase family protein [Kitasatospora azatica]
MLRRLAAVTASTAIGLLGPTVPVAHADAPPVVEPAGLEPAGLNPAGLDPAVVNLATNPGFEIPTLPLADYGSIPGWNCGAGEATVTADAHSGSAALSVTPAGAASPGQCGQTVSVRPDTTYTLSAWVNGSYVFLGATGTGHDVPPAWTASTDGGWQQLTTSFTTGADTSSVQLYLHGWYNQGGYRADDVELDGPAVDPARATWNVPTTDRVVFFTIDDGWYRTPEAARFIADHQLPITAFPLPMPSGFQPDYFQQVTAVPGSSVQDHTVSHRDLTTLSPAEQQAEICSARDIDQRIYGSTPTVFRPPYFAYNAATLQAAANCGLRTVLTATADFSFGASTVYRGGLLQPGDVVIMHFTDTLAADLQRALDAANAAGLRPAGLITYLH